MNLTEEQRQLIKQWVEEGCSPGEVQKRLKEQLGLSLTYLDLRLLLDDLKAVPKDEPEETKTPEAAPKEAEEDFDDLPPGRVQVTLDQVSRPNALVSGKVTFSDGQRAEWYVDALGRPALLPEKPGYRPPQEDIMAFQMELQRAISRAGL